MTPGTVACQALLSRGFLRQEYWSGLPFPPPGDFPDPGIKCVSPASLALASGFLTTEPPGILEIVILENVAYIHGKARLPIFTHLFTS